MQGLGMTEQQGHRRTRGVRGRGRGKHAKNAAATTQDGKRSWFSTRVGERSVGGQRGSSEQGGAGIRGDGSSAIGSIPAQSENGVPSTPTACSAAGPSGSKRSVGGAILGAMRGDCSPAVRLVRGTPSQAAGQSAASQQRSLHPLHMPAVQQHASLDQRYQSASSELQTYAVPHVQHASRLQHLHIGCSTDECNTSYAASPHTTSSRAGMGSVEGLNGTHSWHTDIEQARSAVDSVSDNLADMFVSDKEWPFAAHEACDVEDGAHVQHEVRYIALLASSFREQV